MLLLLGLCLLATLAACEEEKVRFDGYHLVSVGPMHTREEVQVLQDMRSEYNYKFYLFDDNIVQGHNVTVMAAPDMLDELYTKLAQWNLPYSVIRRDQQQYFDEVMTENERRRLTPRDTKRPVTDAQTCGTLFTYYPRYSAIVDFMYEIEDWSGGRARVGSIGTTYQGRDIMAIVIEPHDGDPNAPTILIDSAHHCREWLTPTTALHIADLVVDCFNPDLCYRTDVDLGRYRWYIVPVVNPDGYEYTHTTNNMWRKNRVPNSGTSCVGTDLNRNYDYRFAQCSDSNQCSETYHGTNAFSAPETQAMRDLVMGTIGAQRLMLAISIHSYSQFWLLPGGCPNGYYTPDHNRLTQAGDATVRAIKTVNNRDYRVGTVWELLWYAASGTTFDWTYHSAGVKHSFSPELYPTGPDFQPHPSNICPVAQELFAGVVESVYQAAMDWDA